MVITIKNNNYKWDHYFIYFICFSFIMDKIVSLDFACDQSLTEGAKFESIPESNGRE